ncbi:serine hydroxymethyltransferase, partial [candidate division KSB1 bacterium]|nr:serine hydroxymethyltransferase [candidate division KSB1 bacterium]
AAMARALSMVARPEFKKLAKRIVDDARTLAKCFIALGYRVITGGSDNHLVVIDVLQKGLTGIVAERALEDCHIVVNKNRIPGDQKSPTITSGIRIGTNSLARREMGPNEMAVCADLVHRVLAAVKPINDREYAIDETKANAVRESVQEICKRFPIPNYPF